VNMRTAVFVVLALLAAVVIANAQTVTSYNLAIFIQGGASPISTAALPAASFVCGQPRVVVTAPVANPNKVVIEDPANAALDCVYVDGGSGPLLALPFNPTTVYVATLAGTNSAGTGPASAASNSFTRPGSVPSAPRQVRIGG
jgi:hypothetical protein